MTVLIDSNIPMYLVGVEHPNKSRALVLLDQLVISRERLVTDAEVLQEILHRYRAISRVEAIQPAFDAVRAIVDDVLPITVDDVEVAKSIVLADTRLSARDAIHLAVMAAHGISRVMTFDAGFEGRRGVERIA